MESLYPKLSYENEDDKVKRPENALFFFKGKLAKLKDSESND